MAVSVNKKISRTKIKKISFDLDKIEKDARGLQKKVVKRIDDQKIKTQANKILTI